MLFISFSFGLAVVDVMFWSQHQRSLLGRFKNWVRDNPLKGDIENPAKFVVDASFDFLNEPEFEKFIFDKALGAGTFGVVYQGTNTQTGEQRTVKVMVSNRNFDNCHEAWDNYKKVSNNSLKVPYIVDTKKPIGKIFKDTPGIRETLFVCGIEMELATDAEKPIFATQCNKKAENTGQFIGFSQRVLECFSELNNKNKIYHADIKPANLLWKKTTNGIEPRLIDFDLTFQINTRMMTPTPEWVMYTLGYRPPELTRIVPETNANRVELQALRRYPLNQEFKEEAWAVGQTLQEIYETNQECLDRSDEGLKALLKIFQKMLETNIKDRLSNLAAFQKSLAITGEQPAQEEKVPRPTKMIRKTEGQGARFTRMQKQKHAQPIANPFGVAQNLAFEEKYIPGILPINQGPGLKQTPGFGVPKINQKVPELNPHMLGLIPEKKQDPNPPQIAKRKVSEPPLGRMDQFKPLVHPQGNQGNPPLRLKKKQLVV